MPIDFNCPYCGRIIEAPDEAAGQAGTCRFCGAAVVAPSEPGQPAELLQPGSPAAAPYGAADTRSPSPTVDPGAVVGEAWSVLKTHWSTILASQVIAVVAFLILLAPVVGVYIWPAVQNDTEPQFGLGYVLSVTALSLVAAPLLAGPLFVIDRILVHGDANVGAVFLGFRRFGSILLFTLLFSLPQTILQVLQTLFEETIPGLSLLMMVLVAVVGTAMWIIFRPGLMEIVDRGAGAVEALKVSWEITKGKRLLLLATWILLTLVSMLGFLACCIGYLFTMLFVPVGEVLVYRHLRGLEGRVE